MIWQRISKTNNGLLMIVETVITSMFLFYIVRLINNKSLQY